MVTSRRQLFWMCLSISQLVALLTAVTHQTAVDNCLANVDNCLVNVDNCLTNVDNGDRMDIEDQLDRLTAVTHQTAVELRDSISTDSWLLDDVWKRVRAALATANDLQCPEPRFLCTLGLTCLSQYQVCDGHKDCVNGEDEAECDIRSYIRSGDILDGYLVYDRCIQSAAERFSYTIHHIADDVTDPLGSRVIVHNTIVGASGTFPNPPKVKMVLLFRWLFSTRTLHLETFYSSEIDYHLGFRGRTRDWAKIYGVRASNGEVCAIYDLHRRTGTVGNSS